MRGSAGHNYSESADTHTRREAAIDLLALPRLRGLLPSPSSHAVDNRRMARLRGIRPLPPSSRQFSTTPEAVARVR